MRKKTDSQLVTKLWLENVAIPELKKKGFFKDYNSVVKIEKK